MVTSPDIFQVRTGSGFSGSVGGLGIDLISILVFYLSAEVGAGTSVWTVEGDKEKALGEDGEDLSDNEDGDDSTKERKSAQKASSKSNLVCGHLGKPKSSAT